MKVKVLPAFFTASVIAMRKLLFRKLIVEQAATMQLAFSQYSLREPVYPELMFFAEFRQAKDLSPRKTLRNYWMIIFPNPIILSSDAIR